MKQQSELKPLKCYVRMLKNEFNDDDFTTLEIDVPNENENNDEKSIIYQLKHLHEIFDVSIANNYIVLISSSPNITLEEINKPIYTKGLAIMGFLGSREKSNCTEYRRILTTGNFMALKQFFKKEWNVCYFRPIQKITTFLRYYKCFYICLKKYREYSSLDLISSSNMLNQILTPKILQNRDFSQIGT